jgi:HSP20 family molecular chaperone IbpA
MATNQGVAQRESPEVAQRRPGGERTLVPPVDIFEDDQHITVQAEMPGVAHNGLIIQAERNGLLIEGSVDIALPEGMEALYADVQATKYRRSFVLSSELDTERIDASLRDGLLTLRIPKRAEFRPRKIPVQLA